MVVSKLYDKKISKSVVGERKEITTELSLCTQVSVCQTMWIEGCNITEWAEGGCK